MNILKSIWAVLAGFIVVFALSIGTDKLMEATGIFPVGAMALGDGLLALAFIYRSIYTILGGYVVASLAPQNPMRHIVVSGVLGTIGGIAGAIGGWNLSHHWYPIALAATGFLFTWVGGKLKVRQA